MRLLRTLIQRELLENLTSVRYGLTSILCLTLCITSIVLMSDDYRRRLARYNVLMSDMTEEELKRSLRFAKQPQPLSVIARGVDEMMGRPARIHGWQPEEEPIAHVDGRSAEGQHLFDLFTTPDFVYIVGLVLSAFAIFLSFGTICGEKQTHTLSLLMSHPIRRSTLLFAKWMGGYISLLISLCPAILLMLAFLTAFSDIPLQTEHWMRLLGIMALSFVYLLIFFTLGLCTSTVVHRPATALVLVLFVWAVWVLGVPRVGCSVAKGLRPIQPNFTFGLNKRAFRQGSFEEFREPLWNMDDAYIATVDAQTRMGQTLSRVSPLASYIYASSTLAQTGIPDAQRFRRQVADWDRERRRGRYSPLSLRPLSPAQSFLEMTTDLILLLSWNVLLFTGAHVAFLRYDVR